MRCAPFFLMAALVACDGSGDDAAIDAPAGAVCGGFAGTPCGPSEYCDWDRNTCGATDEQGTCRPRPTVCPDPLPQPVCGCDGVVYPLTCDANLAGADVSDTAICSAPADTFACGHRFCRLADQYCQHQLSDIVGVPDDWTCLALPAGCGAAPSCACLTSQSCGTTCTGTGAAGLQLTCPGG